MSDNKSIIKIIANHTREMNELDTTYKKLGVKHIALLNDYADLKILADNLKKENKKLRKLSEEQRDKFVEDLKWLNDGFDPYPSDPLDILVKKWGEVE